MRLMSAFVTFEDANFEAVAFDLIERAQGEMRIAAAFGAADWSNECQVPSDKGTPFHSPRLRPLSPLAMKVGKARGIWTKQPKLWKTI
jgi:hypothetical protein